MKQKVVISLGQQIFEFDGEILEFNDDFLTIKTAKSEVYIERKYVAFIQFLNEETEEPVVVEQKPQKPMPQKLRDSIKFVNKRIKNDPIDERLRQRIIPPSQLPDNENEHLNLDFDEDDEAATTVLEQIYGPNHPIVRAAREKQELSFKDSIKEAMNNTDNDFSMGDSVKYKSPLQMVLGLNNASGKKTRDT